MTDIKDTPAEVDTNTGEIAAVDADKLVRLLFAQIETGKLTFGEAIAAVLGDRITKPEVKPEAPAVIAITEADRLALAEILDQYGKVAPATPRLLTAPEQKAIVEERATIDRILALLSTRKDASIRETLANHLDKVAERDGLAQPTVERDSRGHFCLKQNEPVKETSLKISRSVTVPKPVVSSASIAKAYEDGDLTREEYLSVTKVPEVSREFDELKARKAIKANHGLLFKLAKATTQAPKSTTIKVLPNKG